MKTSPVAIAAAYQRKAFSRTGQLAISANALGIEFEQITASSPEVKSGVAVVEVIGPLMHHKDFWFDSYDCVKERVRAALESGASCVLLSVDSPGGLVAGCFDTVRECRAMARAAGIPIYSYIDAQSASGGYALACIGETIFIPPSGIAGSIGVISDLVDATAMDAKNGERHTLVKSGARKADGNPHSRTTSENVAAEQAIVDSLAAQFSELVAECRGMSVEAIDALEAGVFVGESAISAGLADELATLDSVLAYLSDTAAKRVQGTGQLSAVSAGERMAAKFREEDHPRDDDGKFGSGGGGGKKSEPSKSESEKKPAKQPAKKSEPGKKKETGKAAPPKAPSKDGDSKTVTSEKHGQGKVRSKDDLLKELPKDKNGKQRYEGFPVETINKVHEFSGETGLKAVIFRKDRNGKEVQTYKYTSEHDQNKADAKFKKAVKMSENIGTLRKRAEKDSSSSDKKTADAAVVVRLIDSTTIRVGGSDSEKDTGSVGATTLRAEHVIKNKDGSVNLKFMGKSHKEWDRRIDGPLAKEILKRTEGKKPGDQLFSVSASDVNSYLATASPDKITAKDFRTFHASEMAFSILAKAAPPPKISAKEAEANIKKAVEETSKFLGNTPTICREKYINPRVLDAYRNRVVLKEAA